MIGFSKIAALAGLVVATVLAGSAQAQSQARPTTPAAPPVQVQPGAVDEANRIIKTCSGRGRGTRCEYLVICNRRPAGTFTNETAAFLANLVACPGEGTAPPGESAPVPPTPRDPGALRAAPRPSVTPPR